MSFKEHKLCYKIIFSALKLRRKSIKEIVDNGDKFFYKLRRIGTTYARIIYTNRFKLFMIYVYRPTHYTLTKNNATNSFVFLTVRYRVRSLPATCSQSCSEITKAIVSFFMSLRQHGTNSFPQEACSLNQYNSII